MTIDNNFAKVIENITASPVKHTRHNQAQEGSKSFADILRKAADSRSMETENIKLRQYQPKTDNSSTAADVRELIFSKHAQQRISQRNIAIEPELMEKITGAAKRAYDKNIKNALILADGAAFIVNTRNNVVVTTMNNSEMKDSIITNIDGTVIL